MRWGIVKSELRRGILGRWKNYLLVALLIILVGFVEMRQAVMCYEAGLYELPSFGNYIVKWMQGMLPLQEAVQRQIKIPGEWLVLQVGYIFFLTGHCAKDLNKDGYQRILRSGGKIIWWKTKCVWIIVSTLLYYAMFLCLLAFFSLMTGGIQIRVTSEIWMCGLQYGPELECIVMVFVLPIVGSMCIGFMQILLEIAFSPVIAIIFCSGYLLAGIYKNSVLFIGNTTMLFRNSFFLGEKGISTVHGLLVSVIAIILFYFMGKEKMKRWEG